MVNIQKTKKRIKVVINFSQQEKDEGCIITIQEYRRILNDTKSSNEQVVKRLKYLEALCRNVIRFELENHDKKTAKYTTK